MEIMDDTASPNTYRWRKGSGAWSAETDLESTAHPVGGLGGEGVTLEFAEVVGHTAVRACQQRVHRPVSRRATPRATTHA